jgi:3-oxoacyl-[acyl-carrier protein] reductase
MSDTPPSQPQAPASLPLTGRRAVVTGSSRGIGKAIALALAAAGADVAVHGRSEAGCQESAAQIESLGRECLRYGVDLSETAATESMFADILTRWGRIDILVNNAGVTRDSLLLRMKEDDWDEVLRVNLKSAFTSTKAASKAMMRQRSGTIINIASVVGISGNAGQANYSASKAGLIGFTKSMARELASRGITVNAVAPGYIDTDMTAGLSDELKQKVLAGVPLGRLGAPEDIAHAVLFLASDGARYITGQTLVVDGGMTM